MSSPAGPIIVVYEAGAVSPQEIALGLDSLGPLVFLIPDSPHTRLVRPILDQLGTVLPLTGNTIDDLATIRAVDPATITTFSETMLPATAVLANELGFPFHDMATVGLLTGKLSQRQRLREAGVDDVRGYPLYSPDDWSPAVAQIGLPVVIKPSRGAASLDTHRVSDAATGARLVEEIFATRTRTAGDGPELIVEEYLQGAPDLPFGDYVSVESLCGPHEIRHLAITGKFPLLPPFRESGRFWPALLSPADRERIGDLVTRALRALGVTFGLIHTEVKLTAAGPRMIEVNGRLGGHINSLARAATGTNLVHVAGLAALGRAVDVAIPAPERVHFHYHALAPVVPCRLIAVHRAVEVRRMPGISGYRMFSRIGDELPGGVPTNEIDVLWGAYPDHASMADGLRIALDTLAYDLEFPDGVRRFSGAQLRDWSPS